MHITLKEMLEWPIIPPALERKRKTFECPLGEAETMTSEVGITFVLKLDDAEELTEDGDRLGDMGRD
jgi:hypothetical protein